MLFSILLLTVILAPVIFIIIQHFVDEQERKRLAINQKQNNSGGVSYSLGSGSGSGYSSRAFGGTYGAMGNSKVPPLASPYKHVICPSDFELNDFGIKKIKIFEKLMNLIDIMIDYKKIKKEVTVSEIIDASGVKYKCQMTEAEAMLKILNDGDVYFMKNYLSVSCIAAELAARDKFPTTAQLKQFNLLHKKYSG